MNTASTEPMSTAKPFLWGPVKNALLQEARAHGPETIVRLCFTTDQRVKEMTASVLADLGRDDRARADAILRQLFPLGREPGRLQRMHDLVRPPQITTPAETRTAQEIAIQVASELGIPWVLQASARHPDSTLRAEAVRWTYHLWQRDEDAGFAVLDDIAAHIMHGLIPDLAAFEAVFGLSLSVFFDHSQATPRNLPTLHRLQATWRAIIDRVFGLKGAGGRAGQVARDFIRERIFSFALSQCFRLLDEMPAYNLVNRPDVDAFFHLAPREKALYKQLIRYLDVDGAYTQEEMEQVCRAILPLRSLLIEGVLLMVFVAHAVHARARFLPFLQRFFVEAQAESPGNPYVMYIPWVTVSLLSRNVHDEEAFALLVSLSESCAVYYGRHPQITGMRRVVPAPAIAPLGDIVRYSYLRDETIHTVWLEEWLHTHIDAALSSGDREAMEFLIKTQLPTLGIEWRMPRAALETLGLFFGAPGSPIAAEVNEMTAVFLAKMRLTYPDEVDDFLEDQQTPPELRLRVRTNEPDETIGEQIGGTRALTFLLDSASDSPALRAVIMDLFSRAAEVKDLRAWLDYGFRAVVNVVYGSKAL